MRRSVRTCCFLRKANRPKTFGFGSIADKAGGKELEIKIVPAEVGNGSDIGSAYDALAAAGVEVVVVEQSNMLVVSSKQIAEAAAAKKLPTVYGYREHVEAGGLISY